MPASFPVRKAMTVRQRALHLEAKDERRCAILDAVERLFIRYPRRLAGVAEVASAAGVAKGTIYLYFASKEELLLALHERNSEHFFTDLIERLQRSEHILIDDVLEIVRARVLRSPTYLPLAGLWFG